MGAAEPHPNPPRDSEPPANGIPAPQAAPGASGASGGRTAVPGIPAPYAPERAPAVQPPAPPHGESVPGGPAASPEGRAPQAPGPRTGPGPETPAETTTRLRPVTDGPPRTEAPSSPPRAEAPLPPPAVLPPHFDPAGPFAVPTAPTARLWPPVRRSRGRVVAAAACLVLGLGLIAGAVTGTWLTGESGAASGEAGVFAAAAEAWHSQPVDTLFPTTVVGVGTGPGGADRRWTRLGVAPDSDCAKGLSPRLTEILGEFGCERLIRATYTDATHTHVTTVGMVFTQADMEAMNSLRTRFRKEKLATRADLMPRTYPVKGTAAADFGPDQRASWTLSVRDDAPVVVFAVSGFADGRAIDAPEPAAEAMTEGATSTPAQAGLGHAAQGLSDRIGYALRQRAVKAMRDAS
ncbi:hypothetical protein [Streptomyces sp. KLOTTS4A1]|uniref:hypothetical protein n=1 Tax=Streptomyces sp. KLOTTS4A1 TaxID=3390996 RepID=UPI0039F5ACB2